MLVLSNVLVFSRYFEIFVWMFCKLRQFFQKKYGKKKNWNSICNCCVNQCYWLFLHENYTIKNF